MARRGAAKGTGKGYRNLARFPNDPKIHGDSARGRKQPQRIGNMTITPAMKNKSFEQLRKSGVYLTYQGDKDGDGVPNIKDCKPLDKTRQDDMAVTENDDFVTRAKTIAPSKADIPVTEIKAEPSLFQKARGLAGKGSDIVKEKIKQKRAEAKQAKIERREAELTEIKHPLVKKLEKQKDRVSELRTQIELEEKSDEIDKLQHELDKEEEQLRGMQESITHINLEELSDSQLRILAVRAQDSDSLFAGLFGDSGNRYEKELLRRQTKRHEIKQREKELEKKLKEKKPNESIFGF